MRPTSAANTKNLRHGCNNYWKGHWIKHPAQINLHGLPADLVTKILLEFVEVAQRAESPPIRNYEDWLRASFGNTFAETFPMEYTIKYHTTTAANMNTEWIGPRLYRPKLEEVLRGALQPSTDDVHYISGFRYPSHGGFVSYLEPFRKIADIKLGHKVVRIDPKERLLYFENGATAAYDGLVSSIPLPELIPMIDGAPRDVLEAAARLACSEVVIVNLGIDRPDLVDAHWTYFYDRDIFFTRLSTPHLQSPHNVPAGMREPAGRVLLLEEVPAARSASGGLHRAGDRRSQAVRRAARGPTASCSATPCTFPMPT